MKLMKANRLFYYDEAFQVQRENRTELHDLLLTVRTRR